MKKQENNEFKSSETITDAYSKYSGSPKWGVNSSCLSVTGLFITRDESKSLLEQCQFKTEEEYDFFANEFTKNVANINAKNIYDIRIKETNGCLVSYKFDYFKKMIFSKK